jgi:hypothetical protein
MQTKPLIILSALLLAGCAPRVGDFGRPLDKEGARFGNSYLGNMIAAGREEPYSTFKFTDDEVELRDRAWRFLMPENDRNFFFRFVADMRVKRALIPVPHDDKTHYYRTLDWVKPYSPAPRYQTLTDDIAADLLLIDPFLAVAQKVMAADRVRVGALASLTDAEPEETANVDGRVAENIALLDWVYRSWVQRHLDYKYALERLVIATPQHHAIPAERMLRAFEAKINAINPGDLTEERKRILKGGSSLPNRRVIK